MEKQRGCFRSGYAAPSGLEDRWPLTQGDARWRKFEVRSLKFNVYREHLSPALSPLLRRAEREETSRRERLYNRMGGFMACQTHASYTSIVPGF